MKISIIIPVYNVEAYIEDCLNSVIAQTYKDDLECLIVDDCGTDDSMAIAERIIRNYQGRIEFQVLHHEHNRGLSAARNTGIEASTGDYVYFLDSDDSIIPECLELMVDVLRKYPKAEIVQAGAISDLEWINNKLNTIPEYTDDKDWITWAYLQRTVIPIPAWNKLIIKKLFVKNSLSFREGIIHEDELFNFYLAKYVSRIAFLKKNTYIYRTSRQGSIMCGIKASVTDEAWLTIMEECINNIDSYNRKDQVIMIFKVLHEKYVFQQNAQHKQKAKALLRFLSKHTDLIGNIVINTVIYMPRLINRKHFFYHRIIDNYCTSFL